MEDSFIARVDKIFGSLASTTTTTSSSSSSSSSSTRLPSSLWSLSDAEIEKKEWNRQRDDDDTHHDREDIPCSASFNGFYSNEPRIPHNKKKSKTLEFEGDLEDLDDDEEEDDDDDGKHDNEEDWDIRGSIGLDATLDDEDEEDEFDKVAVGRENTREERTFMKDVTDHGKYLNSYNVLPNLCNDQSRDPLTDHLSARVDFPLDDDILPVVVDLPDEDNLPVDRQVKVSEDGGNVKPILKRKENKSDMKLAKRVKFDLGSEDQRDQELQTQSFTTVAYSTDLAKVTEDSSSVPKDTSGVPDYLRNPSKYTKYEFDTSSELSEESNRGACMDFLNMIRKSKTPESEGAVDLPKSITFTPKKKTGDTEMKQKEEDAFKEPTGRVGIPLSIAAGEELENEACAMDEDVQETTTEDNSGSCRKPGRQYRSKISYDDSVS